LDKRLSAISFKSEPDATKSKVNGLYSELPQDLDTLNKVIDLENIYGRFPKQLYTGMTQKLTLDELIVEKTGITPKPLLEKIISFKILNPNDTQLNKLYYNSQLASDEMKQEMIDLYTSSVKSLEQISVDLGRKYGINVSKTTISNHARKHYDALESKHFKNRRDIQEYYKLLFESMNTTETSSEFSSKASVA
jgi:hypothetical protein